MGGRCFKLQGCVFTFTLGRTTGPGFHELVHQQQLFGQRIDGLAKVIYENHTGCLALIAGTQADLERYDEHIALLQHQNRMLAMLVQDLVRDGIWCRRKTQRNDGRSRIHWHEYILAKPTSVPEGWFPTGEQPRPTASPALVRPSANLTMYNLSLQTLPARPSTSAYLPLQTLPARPSTSAFMNDDPEL